MFTAEDYRQLYNIVFNEDFPGYTPTVKESPNGDGVIDGGKRYAHIKRSVLDQCTRHQIPTVSPAFYKALDMATDAAIQMGLPEELWPDENASCLRVLHYPPGEGSAEHTDFDLFTLNLFRNMPDYLFSEYRDTLPKNVHGGELLEILYPIPAQYHWVAAHPILHQYSMVFFAIPNHNLQLPSGQTVGEWIEERKQRSRY